MLEMGYVSVLCVRVCARLCAFGMSCQCCLRYVVDCASVGVDALGVAW